MSDFSQVLDESLDLGGFKSVCSADTQEVRTAFCRILAYTVLDHRTQCLPCMEGTEL